MRLASTHRIKAEHRTFLALFGCALAGVALFLAVPGAVEHKSRFVLHGLCAQTPTHSFVIGGELLPFDARMTGIYTGAGITLVALAAAGRFFRHGIPSRWTNALLALPVLALAADGFNSLFADLDMWHPWEPRNVYRLITGYGTGIAIACLLGWLVGTALYRLSGRTASISGVRGMAILWLPLPIIYVLLDNAPGWMYDVIAAGLMLSAWTVVSMLAFVMLILIARLDERIIASDQVVLPSVAAAVIGLVVMLLLALGRVWLYRVTGMPTTLDM